MKNIIKLTEEKVVYKNVYYTGEDNNQAAILYKEGTILETKTFLINEEDKTHFTRPMIIIQKETHDGKSFDLHIVKRFLINSPSNEELAEFNKEYALV